MTGCPGHLGVVVGNTHHLRMLKVACHSHSALELLSLPYGLSLRGKASCWFHRQIDLTSKHVNILSQTWSAIVKCVQFVHKTVLCQSRWAEGCVCVRACEIYLFCVGRPAKFKI